MYIWMKVTRDEYELPVAVADTAKELAVICGTTVSGVLSSITNDKKRGYNCVYKKVKIEE